MPIPYVNVSSDIMQAYMAGRQMAMAMAQMQNERERIGIERQRANQENAHRIAEQAHATAALAQLTKYQQAEVKREQEKADFDWEHGKKQDIQAGLEGLTPGQPQMVQTGAPRVSNEQAAQDLLRPDALPSPQDQTQSIVDQAPTSDEAIAGAPTTPELQFQQPIGPKPLVAGPQNVIPTQSFVAPDMVSPSGRVRISAAQQAAIPVKPPLSEEERLRITHENAMQLEGKRQEQEQRRLEEEGKHWTAQIAVQNRQADLSFENLVQTMGLRRDMMGMQRATKLGAVIHNIVSDPNMSKQLQVYGPLKDYNTKLTTLDPKTGTVGNTSPIEDMGALSMVQRATVGTPLAGITQVGKLMKSIGATSDTFGQIIDKLTKNKNGLLSNQQKYDLGQAVHAVLKNTQGDFRTRMAAGYGQAELLGFDKTEVDKDTPFSSIINDKF